MSETSIDAEQQEVLSELILLRRKHQELRRKAEDMLEQASHGIQNLMHTLELKPSNPPAGIRFRDGNQRTMPSWSEIKDIRDEMENTCNSIYRLNEKLRQWGVID